MKQKKYNRYMKFLSNVMLGLLFALAIFVPFVHAEITSGNLFPNPLGDSVGNSLYGFVYFVLTNIVMPIGSVVVVFFIIYAGFLFVTARGNEKKLESAKKTFLAVVIGAVILLGSWTIASAIKGTLCQISGGNIPDLCN